MISSGIYLPAGVSGVSPHNRYWKPIWRISSRLRNMRPADPIRNSGISSSCSMQAFLEELNQLVRNAFAEREVDENTYVSIRGGKETAKRDDYSFHYHAPTLVVVTNRKTYPNAMADCACALENMQLAAHSLGLGSCWINQLTWFGEEPAIRTVLDRLGVPEDEKVFGALAIGYPAGTVADASPRKGNPFVFIR